MGNLQRQTLESIVALAGSGTVVGKTHDMEGTRAGAINFSLTITRDAGEGDTDVDLIVEHSHDASIFRTVELTNHAVSAGTPTQEFDKVYPATRRYLRARIVNKTGNALSVTEFISLRKELP